MDRGVLVEVALLIAAVMGHPDATLGAHRPWRRFNRKNFSLSYCLKKSLEFWLEIPYTKKICVRFNMESQADFRAETQAKIFSIELGPWRAT